MKDAPAFDFYPERWLASTAGMSDKNYRIYHQLLCHSWLSDGLPKDEVILKRIVGRKVPKEVMDKFLEDGGVLKHSFLEDVRVKQRLRIDKSRKKVAAMNAAKEEKRLLVEARKHTLVEPLQERLVGPPHHSPLTTHPVLLEKEPKGAEAPLLPPAVEPQSRRIPDEEPAKPGSRPTGRAALRAEAEATNLLPLPPDLNSPEFRAVWGEWCQHRARLAGQGKPWSAIAARNLLRQCCDNGEAWAIAEIRQALASGWQGVQWDQRRNPSDVRSQPLKPNGNNPQGTPRPAPIVTRNTAPLPAGRQSLNALAWKPAPRVQDDERSGA